MRSRQQSKPVTSRHTTIGDNLPNEDEIHAKYGSKSFLFFGSSHALSEVTGSVMIDEFGASPEEIARIEKVRNRSRRFADRDA